MDIDQNILSPAEQSIFVQLSGVQSCKEMDVRSACAALQTHTDAVGLPYGSFHRLRHDFATHLKILFGDEVARMLLNHIMKADTLNRHYTEGIAVYNLMRIRAGKSDDGALKDKLKFTNYEEARITGFAH
ncbi:uncharacterized protein PSFLO_01940 [Pseudozyma flocculosa]|uniref:Uncharacterized protein n=1 Tax=Pseudozyma flocculosa TaxID=84751 RepID=A0A5C3EZ80_9BASI|nr:uncharacterized protein PSFLO_01940 [Pseudozyma flocculosa]